MYIECKTYDEFTKLKGTLEKIFKSNTSPDEKSSPHQLSINLDCLTAVGDFINTLNNDKDFRTIANQVQITINILSNKDINQIAKREILPLVRENLLTIISKTTKENGHLISCNDLQMNKGNSYGQGSCAPRLA